MGSRRFFLAWVVVGIAFSLPGCTDGAGRGGTFESLPGRSPFPNLIENGDFERYDPHSKPALWRFDVSAPWIWDEFSAGAGRRSLFIDASLIVQTSPVPKQALAGPVSAALTSNPPAEKNIREPGPGWATAQYRLRGLKPDTAYIFEISLIKDRNIDGVYPVVRLAGRTFRLSDFWGAGKWKRISLMFKTPPESSPVRPPARDRLLSIKIPAGDYRLWLDDLTLREFRMEIIGPNFLWAIPSTDRLIDFKVVLAASPAHLDSRVPGAVVLETNNAGSSGGEGIDGSGSCFPVAGLDLAMISRKIGVTIYFRVEAYQYNKLLAVSKIGKIKIPPLPVNPPRTASRAEPSASPTVSAPAASIPSAPPSASTQTLLRRADFFPIGIYGAQLDDFEALRCAGFNTVVFAPRGPDDLAAALSKAKKLGLSLIVSPDVFMSTAENSLPPSPNNPPPAAPFLAPILAWYLDDEPEGRSVSPRTIRQKRDALRLLGFSQPGAVALCRSWRALDYASAVDVFMSDPYPIPFESISWISENLDEIRSVIGADPSKRVWAVIQAFGWNTDPAIAATGLGRLPAPSELRAMTDLALAHGAQGIFFYTYRSRGYFLPDHADLWAAVKAAVRQLNKLD